MCCSGSLDATQNPVKHTHTQSPGKHTHTHTHTHTEPCKTHTHTYTHTPFYPEYGDDFTKARLGLQKCSGILPMPDDLGWKISHLKQEGEIKAKKYETKEGCVKGYGVVEEDLTQFRMVGEGQDHRPRT